MTTKSRTISLNPEQDAFLDENNISASAFFQEKINELMQMSRITGAQLKDEIRKRQNFQKLSEEARIFIEKKGLLDEWLKERGFG